MTKASRKINDSYYTPLETCEQVFNIVGDVDVLDPCCGDGRLTNLFTDKTQWDLLGQPPINFLNVKKPIRKWSAVVMNPPFTFDKQFVNKALLFSDKVYAILPMSWNKISYDAKVVDIETSKKFLGLCVDNKFILPDGSKRFVNCGIFLFERTSGLSCYVDRRKLFNKKNLAKLGVKWKVKPGQHNVVLRTHGAGAGNYLDPNKLDYNLNTTAYLLIDDITKLPTEARLKELANYSAGIPCLGASEFCLTIVQNRVRIDK